MRLSWRAFTVYLKYGKYYVIIQYMTRFVKNLHLEENGVNNIESTIPAMRKMCDEIKAHSTKLNSMLGDFTIKPIDISKALTIFEQQIKSAESKFTIAFVGTFKTGKSTIINSLLDLKGEARLSSEYDPDTAKSIRLICADDDHKEGEAVVDFNGAYPEERLPWIEAKKYTSQVALNKADDMFKKKAEKISEVRYYIDNPLLKLCNILDLPGTGTGNHSDHTAVTDEKIFEADCFFWVISTSSEPDMETIKNLEKIKHKLLPIINVYQIECMGIKGVFSPEEIIDIIQENYAAYLANADNPVIYYAGEIDNAQQKDEEIRPEWGKEKFTEKVESILRNISSGDRAERIECNLLSAIESCRVELEKVKNDPAIDKVKNSIYTGKKDNDKTAKRLDQCRGMAKQDVKKEADKTTAEIIDILTQSTDSFIYSKMDGLDFKALVKGKKKYGDELLKDYQDNYIRLNSGWVQSLGNDFMDNVRTLLDGIFIDFEPDIEEAELSGLDSKALNIGNFAKNIAATLQKDMLEKFIPILLEVVAGIVLLAIPGLNILDSVYWIVSGLGSAKNLSKSDKLQQKAKTIALQSRAQIRQQKYPITEALKKIGAEVTERYYSTLKEWLAEQGLVIDAQIEKYNNLVNSIAVFNSDLDEQESTVRDLFREPFSE